MTAAFGEAHFETSDGPKIHYRDYSPVGEASGAPVLCLHGLTRNLRDFEELAPRLAGLGRRVIVASQRGRGGSDPDPDVSRYNPAVYASDMLGLLDHFDIEKAVFIGTSMGGLITMIAAAQAPQRLAAAVINDIGPVVEPAGLARILGYVGSTSTVETWLQAAGKAREINGVAFPREKGDAFWLAFAHRTYREEAPGRIVLDHDPAIAGASRQANVEPVNLWPLFEALKPIPSLIVRGGISDLLGAATVEEMHRRKPDLQTVTVPDVGHAPFMTEPSAWAALRAFLTTRRGDS